MSEDFKPSKAKPRLRKKGPQRLTKPLKTEPHKPLPVKPAADPRVVWVEFLDGRATFLTFGDGTVRVYASAAFIDLDHRLVLGLTPKTYLEKMPLLETAEAFTAAQRANVDRYQGGEYLVRLTVAKKLLPRERYPQ